jgi:hypothetical protein
LNKREKVARAPCSGRNSGSFWSLPRQRPDANVAR